jgi:lysozyme
MTLVDQLVRDEEERQFAYDDATGKTLGKGDTLKGNLTIAIGRNLSAKGLSPEERRFLLANDISDASRELSKTFPWTDQLDYIRRDALINMTFNMGIGGLAQFKNFLAALQAGNWTGARNAMMASKWATQVGPRAVRLGIQIESGAYQ